MTIDTTIPTTATAPPRPEGIGALVDMINDESSDDESGSDTDLDAAPAPPADVSAARPRVSGKSLITSVAQKTLPALAAQHVGNGHRSDGSDDDGESSESDDDGESIESDYDDALLSFARRRESSDSESSDSDEGDSVQSVTRRRAHSDAESERDDESGSESDADSERGARNLPDIGRVAHKQPRIRNFYKEPEAPAKKRAPAGDKPAPANRTPAKGTKAGASASTARRQHGNWNMPKKRLDWPDDDYVVVSKTYDKLPDGAVKDPSLINDAHQILLVHRATGTKIQVYQALRNKCPFYAFVPSDDYPHFGNLARGADGVPNFERKYAVDLGDGRTVHVTSGFTDEDVAAYAAWYEGYVEKGASIPRAAPTCPPMQDAQGNSLLRRRGRAGKPRARPQSGNKGVPPAKRTRPSGDSSGAKDGAARSRRVAPGGEDSWTREVLSMSDNMDAMTGAAPATVPAVAGAAATDPLGALARHSLDTLRAPVFAWRTLERMAAAGAARTHAEPAHMCVTLDEYREMRATPYVAMLLCLADAQHTLAPGHTLSGPGSDDPQ